MLSANTECLCEVIFDVISISHYIFKKIGLWGPQLIAQLLYLVQNNSSMCDSKLKRGWALLAVAYNHWMAVTEFCLIYGICLSNGFSHIFLFSWDYITCHTLILNIKKKSNGGLNSHHTLYHTYHVKVTCLKVHMEY